jgi:hypothetical protein
MHRVTSVLKKALTAQVVSFLAGLLASVAVRALFGSLIPLNLGALLILFLVFVVFATTVIVNIRQDLLARLTQSGLEPRVFYAKKSADGDRLLYDPVIDMINSAHSSLRVVSLYRSPAMQSSPGRIRYYYAIDKVLDQHHRAGTHFKYERILQVQDITPGKLDSTKVDQLTLQHCRHISDLHTQGTSLSLHLRQIPSVLSSLSFLIIDNKHIVFGIPTPIRCEDGKLKATQLGTALAFTDYEGSLVREISQLFDDLLLTADPIYALIGESPTNCPTQGGREMGT